MKFIDRKVIKGKAYYYLQFRGHSKNLGSFLPTNLKEELLKFFYTVAKKEFDNLPPEIKKHFRFGSLETLEKLHYLYIVLKHDLWKELYDNFYDELIRLFTYHSNRSEGSKVTKKEIDKFSASKTKFPKTKTDKEIFNSFLAFNYVLSDKMKWTMKSIKHIHALLLDEIDPLIAGKWKNENNFAPGNQLTVDYKKVHKEVKKLLQWLKNEFKRSVYPPELALKFYCRFEYIHPFLDGNGRVGRILLNAILHRFDYPPVIFFSENKQQHSVAIQQALVGRWTKIYKHFLLQVKKTNSSLFNKIL